MEPINNLVITNSKSKNTNTSKRGRKQIKNANLIETESLFGTRDFYPNDLLLRNWLFDKFTTIANQYGFQQYDAPIVELQDLYKRKGGDEIVEQMYSFETKDKKLVSLRPEMTPSLARLLIKADRSLLFPLKWYTIAQCWRFESTTRGRNREHYQWNMDIIGVDTVVAEGELLSAIVSFFKSVNLTSNDVKIKINNRNIINELLTLWNISQIESFYSLLDKLNKLSEIELNEQLKDLNLSMDIIDKLKAIKTFDDLDNLIPNSQSIKDLKYLWELSSAYGYEDWLQFDITIIRGLSYYTGIVFEAFDTQGCMRAICGGGRYDKLLSTYGCKTDKSCVGFGFGDAVIIELLKEKNLLPTLSHNIDDMIIIADESLRLQACKISSILRSKNRKVDIVLQKTSLSSSFKYADRMGAYRAIIIKENSDYVIIKDLRDNNGNKLPKDRENKQESILISDL